MASMDDLNRFVKQVVVTRRDSKLLQWGNWLREDMGSRPYAWLRPDYVPPAPFLVVKDSEQETSRILVEPHLIDAEFRKAWLPFFCRSGHLVVTVDQFQNQQQTTEHSTELPVQQAAGMKRGMEDRSAPPSAKRSHTPPPALSQISPQPDIQMSEEQTPGSAVEINALCEEQINQPDLEAFFDKAGEFYDHYTGEILGRDATIAGIRAELAQMQEFGVFEWKRSSEKPVGEKIISSKKFHKAKGDEVRSRIVARHYADGVFAPEHHAGTPPTWALKLVLSRMVSKSRTRQFASQWRSSTLGLSRVFG